MIDSPSGDIRIKSMSASSPLRKFWISVTLTITFPAYKLSSAYGIALTTKMLGFLFG